MKYYVTLQKFASITVEASSEDEAKKLSLQIPESEYEEPQNQEGWQIVEVISEDKE